MNSISEILNREIPEASQAKVMDFPEFGEKIKKRPFRYLRNIFQLFHDMITAYLEEQKDKYRDDPQRIGYVPYDCDPLFVKDIDPPFFPDMILANNLILTAETLKNSVQQNKILIFQGPTGSGKSTFLNALLKKFEIYTSTPEGFCPEIVWRLDPKKIDPGSKEDPINIPCPSHDHPLLLIPKNHRPNIISKLLSGWDQETKDKIFYSKEFDWLWKKEPCTICSAIWHALREKINNPDDIFSMIRVRPIQYNRRIGEGVCIFGSGDKIHSEDDAIENPPIQEKLDRIFEDSDKIKYVFSRYAKTNNGIYALMDIKKNNITRLWELHNIVSEGVHKVKGLEEKIDSLFLVVMNPEDQENIKEENNGDKSLKSLADRLQYLPIPYVKDWTTEIKIYRYSLGEEIDSWFLPGVMENFARAIISSRISERSEALQEWIRKPNQYKFCCDPELKILKMEFYSNNIPTWLEDKDKENLTPTIRKKLIQEATETADKSISGRDAIQIFSVFLADHQKKHGNRLITMEDILEFLKHLPENVNSKINGELKDVISEEFLEGLKNFYDYRLLQDIKTCLYEYNSEEIAREIKHYLSAINHKIGSEIECQFTGDTLKITPDFFEEIEIYLFYNYSSFASAEILREDTQKKYVQYTLAQEIMVEGKKIEETRQFQELMDLYSQALKEDVLAPFKDSENFRAAIVEFNDPGQFKKYDDKIRRKVNLLIENLVNKFNYSKEGAQKVCIYALDNDLASKFN